MSVEPIAAAELVRTADEWAETIRADLGRAVEGIVTAGRNLISAKADVAHGEWLPMLKQIGISDGYARKLMTVSGNGAISNRSHANDLPKSIETLYHLSRLDADDIEEGIESGAITPDMTRSQARDLATPRSTTVIRDEDGEEAGRTVDDRDIASMSDDEYDDMLADEDHEQWEAERRTEVAPGITADELAELNIPPVGQAKPRRRPLEEGFFDATTRLEKAVTSLKNLGNDDRLPRNKEQVARYRNDLLRAIDALQRVADQLT